jgi:hypothetical protein
VGRLKPRRPGRWSPHARTHLLVHVHVRLGSFGDLRPPRPSSYTADLSQSVIKSSRWEDRKSRRTRAPRFQWARDISFPQSQKSSNRTSWIAETRRLLFVPPCNRRSKGGSQDPARSCSVRTDTQVDWLFTMLIHKLPESTVLAHQHAARDYEGGRTTTTTTTALHLLIIIFFFFFGTATSRFSISSRRSVLCMHNAHAVAASLGLSDY